MKILHPALAALLFCLTCWFGPASVGAATLPTGFIEQNVGSGWVTPVGLAFGKNGDGTRDRAYVWEYAGKVWIVENGTKLTTPLIDISEEVGAWRDYGLLGFALDPDFRTNGYIYLMYVVDRHHLLKFGTAQYNASANEYFNATIGRITRYTARRDTDFRTVDPASRKVLVGETKSTGFPILHQSHGTGHLVFGTDGTLLASCGDGSSYDAVDKGGTSGNSYGPQALADGIITAAENVGAFRCQQIDSLSGKIIRINPATGDGVAGNPYFQSGSPRSARSRVWSYGLRNPYRFCVRPGTGSHQAAAGNPGTLYIGDVGWGTWEDLNVASAPGQNFGWPLFEGMDQHAGYWAARPAGMNGTDHVRPKCDWQHGSVARAFRNGTVSTIGAAGSPVTGSSFGGTASTGGVFYTGTDFPAEWQGSYFHGDYSGQWLRVFDFDAQNQLTRVRTFASGESFVFFASHPETGGIYYCSLSSNTVRRISYAPGGNRPPVAAISPDRTDGSGPLTVQFSSALSSDPDGTALTYAWNFGDGTTSTAANPAKTYSAPGPQRYTATLTVRDAGGATAQAAVNITVNNTAPRVYITSPAAGARYPLSGGNQNLNLTADVSDAEHSAAGLSYSWQMYLVHDQHEHPESPINSATGTVVISPLGGGADATYYYRIVLRVTDPLGAVTTAERLYMPDCGTSPIIASDDTAIINARGGARSIAVLTNDHGAVTDVNPASVAVVSPPSAGTAVPDPVSGRIVYTHNGGAAVSDSFTYRAGTRSGGPLSAPATVRITIAAAGNDPPVARGDAATTAAGTPVVVDLLANDAGGVPSTLVIHRLPQRTALSLDPTTGRVTCVPGTALPADGTDSFAYSVAGSTGLRSEIVPVVLTITAPNSPPVVTNPGSQSTRKGDAVSLQITASDSDGPQALSYSAAGLPAGLSINPATGRITGTVGASAAAANQVQVTVGDGAASGSITFSWAVTSAPASQNGLRAEYFANAALSGTPVLVRNDPQINFEWQAGSPTAGLPSDDFSVRWSGEIVAPFTETFTFYVGADDAVRLWIDNTLVLDKWVRGRSGGYDVQVPMTAGRRTPFKLEYFEGGGWATMFMVWYSARQGWETVPSSALFTGDAPPPDTTPPGVALTGPAGPVTGIADVTVACTEAVTGLALSDFTVINGSALSLAGSGSSYALRVAGSPAATVQVQVTLPAGRCTDASGNPNTVSNTYTVSVSPQPNRAPVIVSPGDQSTVRGTAVSLPVSVSDPDGEAVVCSASGLPPGLSINASTGLISGNLPATAADSYAVTLSVRDARNLAGNPVSFTWRTSPPPFNGLRGEYFANATLSGAPALVRSDPQINFEWQGGSPAAGLPDDDFSVRWTGDIVARYTETYTFVAGADDGIRVWINNVLVLDKWTRGTSGSYQVQVPLVSGLRTPLKVEYMEGAGWATAWLVWYSNSQGWERVPSTSLFPPGSGSGPPQQDVLLMKTVQETQRLEARGDGDYDFVFERTSGSSLACVVEASQDMMIWRDMTHHAEVVSSTVSGLPFEQVRLPEVIAERGHYSGNPGAVRVYFRVRFAEEGH